MNLRYLMSTSAAISLLLALIFQSPWASAAGATTPVLATYEIVPFFHTIKTVVGHSVSTWEAYKFDRVKNVMEICIVNKDAIGNPALGGACSPLQYTGPVPNLMVSSVATLPGPLGSNPGQEIWAIDVNTGQVTFCNGVCVIVREAASPK